MCQLDVKVSKTLLHNIPLWSPNDFITIPEDQLNRTVSVSYVQTGIYRILNFYIYIYKSSYFRSCVLTLDLLNVYVFSLSRSPNRSFDFHGTGHYSKEFWSQVRRLINIGEQYGDLPVRVLFVNEERSNFTRSFGSLKPKSRSWDSIKIRKSGGKTSPKPTYRGRLGSLLHGSETQTRGDRRCTKPRREHVRNVLPRNESRL